MGTTEKVPCSPRTDAPEPFPDHYFGAMEEWDELIFEAINGHERYYEGESFYAGGYDAPHLR